jgi:tRNA(Ile)-lysidine synthase
VISAWKKANAGRDALAGAALSRDLLDEDDVALDAWLDRLSPITTRGTLSLRKLNGVPRAVVRRALHRWVVSCGARVDLSRQAFAALLDDVMTRTARRHSFGSAHFAMIGRTELRLEVVRRKVSN